MDGLQDGLFLGAKNVGVVVCYEALAKETT